VEDKRVLALTTVTSAANGRRLQATGFRHQDSGRKTRKTGPLRGKAVTSSQWSVDPWPVEKTEGDEGPGCRDGPLAAGRREI